MTLLLATIALRPYVFVFLLAFILASTVNFGWKTTLVFAGAAWIVALLCEWSSIHNGFPFGLYHYHHTTYGREIWVLGVPLFDSLSFVFLSFASYSMALLLTAPFVRAGIDWRLAETRELRRSLHVWGLAVLLMVMVDLAADPLSVRGAQWFLGNLFWYDPPGPYFGVPISNFLGWGFVAAINVAIFQQVDLVLNRGKGRPWGVIARWPSRSLLGPLLYVGMICFAVVMLFLIGATNVAWASVFVYLPLAALGGSILMRPSSRADGAAIAAHVRDFPYDANFTDESASKSPWARRA